MRYFSAVKDHLVTRYGTGTYIGASVRVVQEGPEKGQTVIEYDTDQIVRISDTEFAQYAREYTVCLRDGSLAERNEADYQAMLKKHDDAAKKEAVDRKAAEEKAATEAKAAAEAKAKSEREEKKKLMAAEREAEAQSKAGTKPES